MSIAIVTGSAGLVGAACVRLFAQKGLKIVGIDNDMRSYFFGREASTDWCRAKLQEEIPGYQHFKADIRDLGALDKIFNQFGNDISLILHAAAQPSHDWAAKEPFTDFTVNANGTLNLLELTRKYSPKAVFIYCSTNKVYGDTPNNLPLIELESRWEVDPAHHFQKHGIDESMSIDQSKHSIFGASKAAADIMVQEYGRYFDMYTGTFRGGCLTGPGHSGAMLHGFLAYLMKCAITGTPYKIFGYKGKQVRDNIHSTDLANCFYHFYQNPRCGEVYNIGGSRFSNCSMLEAIALCEKISGNKLNHSYVDDNRSGDHIWYISDVRKFQQHYPGWKYEFSLEKILAEIHSELVERSASPEYKLAAN